MYAIVDIAGHQYKVEKKQKLYVNRLEEKEGGKVSFNDVKLIDNDGKVAVGTPNLDGAAVSAKVLKHLKDDKVLVFKKKRRKGYQKMNGHRQLLTQIEIEEITEKGAKKAAPKKKEEKKQEKKSESKSTAKKEEKKEAKKKSTKKATDKKEAKAKAKSTKKTEAKKDDSKE